MGSDGDIMDADPVLYAFKADGNSMRFQLSKGDGYLRVARREAGLPSGVGKFGIWEVCTLDGSTGDIAVAGGGPPRKVLQFNGPVGQANTAAITEPYVKLQGLSQMPQTAVTLAMWVKLDTRASNSFGTILSYATPTSSNSFNVNNVKALQVCAGGDCGVMTSVSLIQECASSNSRSPGWVHLAVTWDATAAKNPGDPPTPWPQGCQLPTPDPLVGSPPAIECIRDRKPWEASNPFCGGTCGGGR